jgi:hypothetical protein
MRGMAARQNVEIDHDGPQLILDHDIVDPRGVVLPGSLNRVVSGNLKDISTVF